MGRHHSLRSKEGELAVVPDWKAAPRRIILIALKRYWPLLLSLALVVVAMTGVALDWTWKRPIAASGGRYFFHPVELAVPSFYQGDERWSDDPLGGVEENGTVGGQGCAVAAVAMLFQ